MISPNKTPASRRGGRTAGIIAREAAQFIARESSSESLITVIRARSAAHCERVTVFVSVFPKEKSCAALAFLERQRAAFSNHLKEYARLSHLPRVDFLLDDGEQLLPKESAR